MFAISRRNVYIHDRLCLAYGYIYIPDQNIRIFFVEHFPLCLHVLFLQMTNRYNQKFMDGMSNNSFNKYSLNLSRCHITPRRRKK